MTEDALFSIFNPLALVGWVALLAYPFAPRVIGVLAGLVIPGLLSLAYTVLILVHWSGAPGGYDSLANVMALFTDPGIALAGWAHYLAFDLFLGTWAARMGREHGVPHVLIIPCLLLTFLFGPVGFVLTLLLVGLSRLRSGTLAEV